MSNFNDNIIKVRLNSEHITGNITMTMFRNNTIRDLKDAIERVNINFQKLGFFRQTTSKRANNNT
jgi:hypothetical protein